MYGILLESVQHFVQKEHGEEAWLKVMKEAGMHGVVFATHSKYRDCSMQDLATACSKVLGTQSTDQFLEFFGQCFVQYFSHYGYDRIVQVSGRHYRDFLRGIDNLHETMRFSFPKMSTPSFYVTDEHENGCYLHYRSHRKGLTYYVIGQLKQCALKFYNTTVNIEVLQEKENDINMHVIYNLQFDNKAFVPKTVPSVHRLQKQYSTISSSTFFTIFPFSIVFNSNMKVTNTGYTLKTLFRKHSMIRQDIRQCFKLRRPRMAFSWENIWNLQSVVFELESLIPIEGDENRHTPEEPTATNTLLLRGQMRYFDQLRGMVFLCSPLVTDLDEMSNMGLYVNDLNLYDCSRDRAMVGHHHASRLEEAIEKEIARSDQIATNNRKLEEWKQKSDSLLYAMIPKSVAVRLKNGESPVNTCQFFESVTVLFAYLAGFNQLCTTESMEPMRFVRYLDMVFSNFDDIFVELNVFKVETLADATVMVAGGVPEPTVDHARRVAHVAMELQKSLGEIKKTMDFEKDQLGIRIGIHTGSVVGGVVGQRTFQYCLFGDTVNTASRMQSYGKVGQIHISDDTFRHLKDDKTFSFSHRGKIDIKGKGTMKTHWLFPNDDLRRYGDHFGLSVKQSSSKPILRQIKMPKKLTLCCILLQEDLSMPYEPRTDRNVDNTILLSDHKDFCQEISAQFRASPKESDVNPTPNSKSSKLHFEELNNSLVGLQRCLDFNQSESGAKCDLCPCEKHVNGEAGKHVATSVPYWTKMATALRRHSTTAKSQEMNGLDLRNHHSHQLCEVNDTNSQISHHSLSQIEEL